LKDRIDAHIHEKRHFTIDELHEIFPYISFSVIYEIVTVQIRYGNVCARWIPECSQMNTSRNERNNFCDKGMVTI
jgi:hypothetical protein